MGSIRKHAASLCTSRLVGGFGVCGVPEDCIEALADQGAKALTCVSNNAGLDDFGLGKLLQQHRVKRMISSYVGENKMFEQLYLQGKLEVELVPQGTLAERIRAGGAGIPAFYTPTGFGTIVEKGGFPILLSSNGSAQIASEPRETRKFDGQEYVMETQLIGDYAFIKAWKGDSEGNLVFRGTARNFNEDMAKAGKITVAEVENLVEAGTLHPDSIHLPGIYVDRIFEQKPREKKIEKLMLSGEPRSVRDCAKSTSSLDRERIVLRAAKELKGNMYVNLGIGLPTLIPTYMRPDLKVVLQSENGLLGMGPYPRAGQEDGDLINAGKETVTYLSGSSTFSSSDSFAMIRGGHVDLTILGGLQVASNGDLANWIVPNKMVKGMGGAMDLVSARGNRVIVVMEHNAKNGGFKIVNNCTLPLTGKSVVDRLITDLGVFDFIDEKLVLVEISTSTTIDEIRSRTEPEFSVYEGLKLMDE